MNKEEVKTQADLVANHLLGTAGTLSAAIISVLGSEQENLEDDLDFCLRIDSKVYCCAFCDWWFEADDGMIKYHDGYLCQPCADNELENADE